MGKNETLIIFGGGVYFFFLFLFLEYIIIYTSNWWLFGAVLTVGLLVYYIIMKFSGHASNDEGS